MATGARMRQQQEQQLFCANPVYNGSKTQWQDKRFQELRAFALEYVKQIVAKADELSREQRCEGVKQQNGQPLPISTTCAGRTSIEAAERVGQVAEQINQRFQLNGLNKQQQQQQQDSRFATQTITISQQPQKAPPVRPPPVAAGKPKHPVAVDEISCEQDEAELARSRGDANKWASGARKRPGLHNRLNWHLFISCFSTCLPQTLVDSMPSSMTKGASGGAGGTAV